MQPQLTRGMAALLNTVFVADLTDARRRGEHLLGNVGPYGWLCGGVQKRGSGLG
ncbi:hypothetical protein [Cellvibrio polysaccharolyticus]|uniref:hypothetical protein n=1 Tax=Cellvibrio polysaccharolyticus TaxID=2082724 RepID=UPI0018820238|nr:hypothetical protein [Cellvibrio polysaccharolyticus]